MFDYLNTIHPSLEEWLTYIVSLHPEDVVFGLERVFPIAERIELIKKDPNDPSQWHSFLPGTSIIVTGTNGKGSTVALLEAMYREAGFKVGAFTSPHFHQFNERLKINGQLVDDKDFCRAFEVIEAARGDIQITWYEFTAVACLWLLQQAECDVCILEVGAGGRKDVVNLINADLSIITNVELDHCQWLGNTREEIGREKAGIFRSGKLAVLGSDKMPQSVIEHAKDLGVSLHQAKFDETTFPKPNLPLPSAACAIQAVSLLALEVSRDQIKQALLKTTLPGRWQKVQGPCEIILDVAHNPAAMTYLTEKIQKEPCSGKTIAVIGMLKDKNIEDTIVPLLPFINEWHSTNLDSDRPSANEDLYEKISSLTEKKCYHHSSVADAMRVLLSIVKSQDRILVIGSFYTVAAAQCFIDEEVQHWKLQPSKDLLAS